MSLRKDVIPNIAWNILCFLISKISISDTNMNKIQSLCQGESLRYTNYSAETHNEKQI